VAVLCHRHERVRKRQPRLLLNELGQDSFALVSAHVLGRQLGNHIIIVDWRRARPRAKVLLRRSHQGRTIIDVVVFLFAVLASPPHERPHRRLMEISLRIVIRLEQKRRGLINQR